MKAPRGIGPIYRFAVRHAALNILRGRVRRGLYLLVLPLDYWRVHEFPVSLEYLDPLAGERILDVSSPKLFAMYVATSIGSHVLTMDIYDDKGLSDVRFSAGTTGITTLDVLICDVRCLPFPDQSFDKAFSISVVEHVSPPAGGDGAALKEIARVLKPGCVAVVTLPFGMRYGEEYRSETIYTRKKKSAADNVFFQRRHDAASLRALLQGLPEFEILREEYVCERWFHRPGRELCTFIAEGNKIKRLSLAPFYTLFGLIFLKRSPAPIPSSEFMVACLKLRKRGEVSKR